MTKNVSVPLASGFDRSQKVTAGADLKYGITSNLTLDATVNPDFGQVEADPAVLNLTVFETFFQERRPFFVQGAGIFRFDVNCSQVNCNGEGLFYSRRIGRAPQLGYGDPNSPTATTIYGAAKLTGRLPGGQTVGVLEAITQRATGTLDSTTEPTTNYAVVRGQQDFRNGESGIGVMLTAVNRSLDQRTENFLRRSAYVGAFDFRHRFLQGHYQVSGSLDLSRVAGTDTAIARTQQDPVHFYQRPGAGVTYDSTRTALSGDAGELFFSKLGGGITRFETSYQRRSQGFEANDLGFLLQADQQSWSTWFGLQSLRPTALYQIAYWNFNWWQYWTAAGTPVERAANTNAHVQLNNRWWVHGGVTTGQLGTTFCDRNCSRGGPAVRNDPYLSAWGEVDGDARPALVPYMWLNYFRGDGGRSERFNGNTQITLRVASQFKASLTLSATHNVNDIQPHGTIKDSTGTHYTFAHLNQKNGVAHGAGRLHALDGPHPAALCAAVREQGHLLERARARRPERRGLRQSLQTLRRHPRRVQRQGVQLHRRAALGIPSGLDAVRGMDAGPRRLYTNRRTALLGGQLPRHVRPAPQQHLPREGVLLDQLVGRPSGPPPRPAPA